MSGIVRLTFLCVTYKRCCLELYGKGKSDCKDDKYN